MPQTTRLITSTVVENNNSRVYPRSAVSSNRASRAEAERACSRVARDITLRGLSLINRSNTEPRIMAASTGPGGGEPGNSACSGREDGEALLPPQGDTPSARE